MKTIKPTELRRNLYTLLDEVLKTGIPLEIDRKGELLRIIPISKSNKLENLVSRPDAIRGDPEDLVDISWDLEVDLDFPR